VSRTSARSRAAAAAAAQVLILSDLLHAATASFDRCRAVRYRQALQAGPLERFKKQRKLQVGACRRKGGGAVLQGAAQLGAGAWDRFRSWRAWVWLAGWLAGRCPTAAQGRQQQRSFFAAVWGQTTQTTPTGRRR
jgi:hypothetical protein